MIQILLIPLIIMFASLGMYNINAVTTGSEHGDTPNGLTMTSSSSVPKGRKGHGRKTHADPNIPSMSMDRAEVDKDVDYFKRDRVIITEPSTGSLLEGNKFIVALSIQSSNETEFRQSYMEKNQGRICISLDRGPFVCWPLYGKMYFTQATEGEHEIVAMLWKNGSLDPLSSSEKVTFTSVHNPLIIQEPLQHPEILERNNPVGASSVHVTYPVVQITSPLAKVSYKGTSVHFQFTLPHVDDDEMFGKHFQAAFVCINVDIASAFSCFPRLGSNQTSSDRFSGFGVVPWLLGLSKGVHTIEAILSHPETGELLLGSSSGTQMFFMAG
jgi:hypothetical protein